MVLRWPRGTDVSAAVTSDPSELGTGISSRLPYLYGIFVVAWAGIRLVVAQRGAARVTACISVTVFHEPLLTISDFFVYTDGGLDVDWAVNLRGKDWAQGRCRSSCWLSNHECDHLITSG